MVSNLCNISLNRAFTIHNLPSISSSSSPHHNYKANRVAAVAAHGSPVVDHHSSRRTANYKPTTWSYEFLQSFKVNDINHGRVYQDKVAMLEREVRMILKTDMMEKNSLCVLELIDDVQRLGLTHRFEHDIQKALDEPIFHQDCCNITTNKSLHEVALRFRILRQNGHMVSQGVFKDFLSGKDGGFHDHELKDMLSLYEASYLAYHGEDILDKAREQATEYLNNLLINYGDDNNMEERLVRHSLEVPLHRRMVMLEARWYVEAYQKKKKGANLALLELAKLEFNMAQSVLQGDLKVVEQFGSSQRAMFQQRQIGRVLFLDGRMFEPRFSSCRKGLTLVTSFITIVDDIYDVYGTLNELELFTNVVERWDINDVPSLPNYMKLRFLALYNTINEMGYEMLKKHGHNTIPYLTKAWADMLKAFLKEARWSHEECEPPTFSEYMENAWRSVSGTVILVHTYCLLDDDDENVTHNINFSKDVLSHLMNYVEILRWPSVIFRLCNDLATSSEELAGGETVNAISCYMNEKGVGEEEARKHMKLLIDEAWKNMNKEYCSLLSVEDKGSSTVPFVFSKSFMQSSINLARISHCTYQTGDGHGAPDSGSKKRVRSLLIDPIT